jgi:hypothetical protein
MSNRPRRPRKTAHTKSFQHSGKPHDLIFVFVCILCKANSFSGDNRELTKTRDGFMGVLHRHHLNNRWFYTFVSTPYHTEDPNGNTIHIEAISCPHIDPETKQLDIDY